MLYAFDDWIIELNWNFVFCVQLSEQEKSFKYIASFLPNAYST